MAAAHPDLGPDHGFDITFDAPVGEGDFCVYAIDGGGAPALVGVDANRSRADVERAFPAYGRSHGFDVHVSAGRLGDADRFCIHAVDPDGPLRKIGCIDRPYPVRIATGAEAGWLADVLAGRRAGAPGTSSESTYRRNGRTHQGIALVPYGPVSFDRRIVGYVHEIMSRYPELHLTSGYRDPNRNRAVGGISDSDHLKGRAVDLNIARVGYYRELQLLESIRAWVDRTYPGVWAEIHGGHLYVSFRQTGAFVLP